MERLKERVYAIRERGLGTEFVVWNDCRDLPKECNSGAAPPTSLSSATM